MHEGAASGYRTPEEYARQANISIEEVWRQLEDGRLPAVILTEYRNRETNRHDYTAISPEVVRAICTGLHDKVEYIWPGYKHVVMKADRAAIRILVDPGLTPDFFAEPDGDTIHPAVPRKSALKGCTKAEVLAVTWPVGVDLKGMLSTVPRWLEEAIVTRGRRGGESSIWNPAMMAVCIHRQYRVPLAQLDRVMRAFEDFRPEWDQHRDRLSPD